MIIFYDKTNGKIISSIFGRVHTENELREDIISTPDVAPENLKREIFDIKKTASFEKEMYCNGFNIMHYRVQTDINDNFVKLVKKPPEPEPKSDSTETITIDLTKDHETIKSEFSETTRRYIKRSEKLQFREIGFNNRELVMKVLKELEDLKDIKLFTELLRIRAPFLDGVRRMYIVEEGTKVLAAAVCTTIAGRFTYTLGGVTKEGREKHAGDRLVWGLIQDAKELGYQTYDFGGIYADWADDTKKKVNEFKKRWGGESKPKLV